MLVASHALPALSRAERHEIAELWQQALRARHPPLRPAAQGLDDDDDDEAPVPGAGAAGKRALGLLSCSPPPSAAGTGAREGATALELVVHQVLRAVAAAAPAHARTSMPRPATGEVEQDVGAMWTRVLELVEAQVGQAAHVCVLACLRAWVLAQGDLCLMRLPDHTTLHTPPHTSVYRPRCTR